MSCRQVDSIISCTTLSISSSIINAEAYILCNIYYVLDLFCWRPWIPQDNPAYIHTTVFMDLAQASEAECSPASKTSSLPSGSLAVGRNSPEIWIPCNICRKRKVRYNKELPCSNCQRLGFECSYDDPSRGLKRTISGGGSTRDTAELSGRMVRLESLVRNLSKQPGLPRPDPSAENSLPNASRPVGSARDFSKAEIDAGKLFLISASSRHVSSFWTGLFDEVCAYPSSRLGMAQIECLPSISLWSSVRLTTLSFWSRKKSSALTRPRAFPSTSPMLDGKMSTSLSCNQPERTRTSFSLFISRTSIPSLWCYTSLVSFKNFPSSAGVAWITAPFLKPFCSQSTTSPSWAWATSMS